MRKRDMALLFSCSLRGRCEPDPDSGSLTREKCRATCRATDLPLEVAYMVVEFLTGETVYLAPSDRVEVLAQVTGVDVPARNSFAVLSALLSEDLDTLARYPVIYAWAERNLYPKDWMLALQDASSPEALRELERLGYSVQERSGEFLGEDGVGTTF
jgi:hypothetical protein